MSKCILVVEDQEDPARSAGQRRLRANRGREWWGSDRRRRCAMVAHNAIVRLIKQAAVKIVRLTARA